MTVTLTGPSCPHCGHPTWHEHDNTAARACPACDDMAQLGQYAPCATVSTEPWTDDDTAELAQAMRDAAWTTADRHSEARAGAAYLRRARYPVRIPYGSDLMPTSAGPATTELHIGRWTPAARVWQHASYAAELSSTTASAARLWQRIEREDRIADRMGDDPQRTDYPVIEAWRLDVRGL